MKRSEVYEQINKEREYQDSLTKIKECESVPAEILLIEHYLNDAKIKWVSNKGDGLCLDSLRKATAIAIRCFENHGCPPRYLGYSDIKE